MTHGFALRVGPVAMRIFSDWAGPIADLRRLYADYPQPDDGVASLTAHIGAARPWRRWLRPAVSIGGDFTIPDALPLPLSQGLLAAEMAMNLQVAMGWRQQMLLHASAVERDGRVLLMVGASGSGKSTLAALLGEGDWRLLGDEFALLDLENGNILPFPRLISLKNQAINVLQDRADPSRFGPRITGTPKGDICHMRPRADAISRMDEGGAPALLLFPAFGSDNALRPVPPSEAFFRLTESSTNYVGLGEAAFTALNRLVRALPAVAIGYQSGEQAIEIVEALWNENLGNENLGSAAR
ncbi:MAG: HprK-related kinase A [Sphingomonadaceae bacterium]|nr:HprK-related kinase A [Sphingomonadaceae bacterium]